MDRYIPVCDMVKYFNDKRVRYMHRWSQLRNLGPGSDSEEAAWIAGEMARMEAMIGLCEVMAVDVQDGVVPWVDGRTITIWERRYKANKKPEFFDREKSDLTKTGK